MKQLVLTFLCALFAVVQAKAVIASGDGWTLDDDGTLTVERNFEYGYASSRPWYSSSSSIKKVVFTSDVTSIGERAFEGCSGLESVEIPSSVTSIGEFAFFRCSGLKSIKVDKGNTTYDNRGNCNAIIETATNTLVVGCKNTKIPSSVTSIGNRAFSGCTGLTGELKIPGGVTSIGNGAFYGCTGLTGELKIPSSVTSIGNSAFSDCTGLTGELKIPSSVTSIGEDAFYGCTGLTGELKIPEGVTSIGEGAFRGCSGLESVVIPSSVTSIGEFAFFRCTGLTSVTIQGSAMIIKINAFCKCTGLTSVTIGGGVRSIHGCAFEGCTSLKVLTIEDGTENLSLEYNSKAPRTGYVGKGLFYDCPLERLYLGRNLYYEEDGSYGYSPFYHKEELSELTIGSAVTSIGDYAFMGCSGLESVEIPSSVTSIGKDAFSGCTGLTSVTIPNSVTSIGGGAFSGCSGLTGELKIPNGVTSIGKGAFYRCGGLTSIKVDKNNKKYDSRDNCNALIETATNTLIAGCKNTTIPSSVTSIGEAAFVDCSGLTSVKIPSSVTSIGNYVFDDCSGLTSVVSLAKTPQELTMSIFWDVDLSKVTLYVPKEAVESYKKAVVWRSFGKIVGIGDSEFEAADAVVKLIDKIGAVKYTKQSKGKIDAARKAYNKLTAVQKALVDNYATLINAEETYKSLATATKTAFQTIQAEKNDSWYEMSGRKLAGKPTRKGVYVHNGKLERVK